MAEASLAKDYTVGHLRMKYLDMANMAFAQRAFIEADGLITAFVNTIDENSNSGIDLKLEFDKIHHIKTKQIAELNIETKELGYLEKQDTYNNARTNIEINAILDKKASCWRIAYKNGLFNE